MTGNSKDETNFLHKLLLTARHISQLCKVFTNDLSANTNLSKTQLYKRMQSGGIPSRLLDHYQN